MVFRGLHEDFLRWKEGKEERKRKERGSHCVILMLGMRRRKSSNQNTQDSLCLLSVTTFWFFFSFPSNATNWDAHIYDREKSILGTSEGQHWQKFLPEAARGWGQTTQFTMQDVQLVNKLGTYPKELTARIQTFFINLHCRIIHKSQNIDQAPTDGWMGKQNVVYVHMHIHTGWGILLSTEKGWNSETCYNMDNFENIMLCEIDETEKNKGMILGWWKGSRNRLWWWVHNIVSTPNTTEFST